MNNTDGASPQIHDSAADRRHSSHTSGHKHSILFLIERLEFGGQQRQLVNLVEGLDKTRFDVSVAVVQSGGGFFDRLQSNPQVEVLPLDKRGPWDLGSYTLGLAKIMRRKRPNVIYGYGMIINELCWFFGKLFNARVVWGIRNMAPELISRPRLMLRLINILRIRKWLMPRVDLAIFNSEAGHASFLEKGYKMPRSVVVISNGIDTQEFSPDAKAREAQLREEWGLKPEHRLIGLVGRVVPRKGHQTFLQAAALLADILPDTRYLCIGSGPIEYTKRLQQLTHELGIHGKVIWTGWQTDLAAVNVALDIANMLTEEQQEGFPNVVAEAMACGTPCVVTDVGDARRIVGNTGFVVATHDPSALVKAWKELLELTGDERKRLEEQVRQHIVDNFSIPTMVQASQQALEGLKRS